MIFEKRYTLGQLYKTGLISSKARFYIDITEKINSLIVTGMSNGTAVRRVATEAGVSRQTIYSALRATKDL